ncbi:hypothetical protein Tco_1268342 [Tanacetum coccineum]
MENMDRSKWKPNDLTTWLIASGERAYKMKRRDSFVNTAINVERRGMYECDSDLKAEMKMTCLCCMAWLVAGCDIVRGGSRGDAHLNNGRDEEGKRDIEDRYGDEMEGVRVEDFYCSEKVLSMIIGCLCGNGKHCTNFKAHN